jgi:DNA-binding beta-propeller fold protein YncE
MHSTTSNHRDVSPGLVACCAVALLQPVKVQGADVFVSNAGNDTIQRISAGEPATVFANTGLDNPMGLAFDRNGNLFVANAGISNSIMKFAPDGTGTVFTTTGLDNPRGLAFDSSGYLYAANASGNSIWKYAPDGTASVFASTGLLNPQGLAFDSVGNLYVVNAGSGGGAGIRKIAPDGTGTTLYSFDFNTSTSGIAIDAANNLYVAKQNGNTIEKFTPGGVDTVFADTGLAGPLGLCFDSSGVLYAANFSGNNISTFTAGGAGGTLAAQGLNAPSFIAVQIVPEPAAWMLAALALPLALRRRRL